jgi:hypothetical protein
MNLVQKHRPGRHGPMQSSAISRYGGRIIPDM